MSLMAVSNQDFERVEADGTIDAWRKAEMTTISHCPN